jgi:hypothetical protein
MHETSRSKLSFISSVLQEDISEPIITIRRTMLDLPAVGIMNFFESGTGVDAQERS